MAPVIESTVESEITISWNENIDIFEGITAFDNIDKDYLFITHTIGNNEEEYILENIPSEIKNQFKNIIVTDAGCVISTHCGKNTIGVLYIKNEHVTK